MVHIYVHHGGSLSQSLNVYAGGEVDDVGNLDPDYLSIVIIKKFVSRNMGYMNVEKLAYKFVHHEKSFTYLTTDDDMRQLLDLLMQRMQPELHLYVVHSVDIPCLVGGNDDDYGGGEHMDDDDYGDGHASSDDVVEVSDDGVEDSDDGVEDSDIEEQLVVGHAEDAATLSDFEGSAGEEQPELYPDNNDKDATKRDRDNVMTWFGSAHSVAREIEEAPQESSEPEDSMSEGDKGLQSRSRSQEFHETDLSAGRRLNLCEGMRFRDLKLFKSALQQFCIQNGFAYSYVKSDRSRVTAKCKAPNCNWRIHCSIQNAKSGFQIKTMTSRHECGTHYINAAVTAKWIAMHYLEKIREISTLPFLLSVKVDLHIRSELRTLHIC